MTRRPTSGKSRSRDASSWAADVLALCDEVGLSVAVDRRPRQAILRIRERGPDDLPTGGTAVLTLYATGSWTWGGDADVVAHAREPIEAHGLVGAASCALDSALRIA